MSWLMRLTHTNQKTHLLILCSIKGIAWLHVSSSNGETTHFWLNSEHEKSDNKFQITLGNASNGSVAAEVATLAKDNKFNYHVVKAVRGNFIGFYATVTETSDTSRVNELDELEINYLKRSFGKWVFNKKQPRFKRNYSGSYSGQISCWWKILI